jgi:hypothetical protein
VRKESPKENFVLAIPDAHIGTLKNTIDHSGRKVRVEAAGAVELCVTKN